MPPKSKLRPPPTSLKPLRLRPVSGAQARAARQPLRPAHETGTASHAQHHVARSAQA